MTERNDRPDNDVTRQLAPLVDDDAFLTDLSDGIDPTGGEDDLAALLLELREDVHADMPPTPMVEGVDDPATAVIPIQTGRKSRPWLHGLIGAAAATVAIAGAGALFLPTITGDGGETTVVELAGTLDEIENKAAEGDIDATRDLVNEARNLVRQLEGQATVPGRDSAAPAPAPVTETVTATATETATQTQSAAPEPGEPAAPSVATTTVSGPPAASVTVTETQTRSTVVTETAVVTVTEPAPVRPNPLTEPTVPAPADGALTPPQVQQ